MIRTSKVPLRPPARPGSPFHGLNKQEVKLDPSVPLMPNPKLSEAISLLKQFTEGS